MLWAILKSRLCDVEPQPSNQEELEEALMLWNNLEQDLIDDLVSTFEKRLRMCVDVFGGCISHFLSAGRNEIKDTDIFDRQNVPHLLNEEDNLLIYEQNLIMNHKWTAISNALKDNFDISPISVKHKVIEFERVLYDFKFHQENYKELPGEISHIYSAHMNDLEYSEDDEKKEEAEEEEIEEEEEEEEEKEEEEEEEEINE